MSASAAAVDRARHQDCGVGPGLAHFHELGNAHTLPLGAQQEVRLVLDLLQPGAEQRRTGVAIHHEAPRLVNELGVTLVATQHGDLERTGRSVGEHQRAAPRLVRRQAHVLCFHPERGQSERDLLGGRTPTG